MKSTKLECKDCKEYEHCDKRDGQGACPLCHYRLTPTFSSKKILIQYLQGKKIDMKKENTKVYNMLLEMVKEK